MKQQPVRALLVDDDSVSASLVVRAVGKSECTPPIAIDWVATLDGGLDALGKDDFDVVLLNLTPASRDPLQTIARVRESAPWAPIVVLSDDWDAGAALDSLKAGVQDYVVASELDHPFVLVRAIHYAIQRQRMRGENDRLMEQLRKAERMASLGSVVGGLSFAFNTVFGTVLEHTDAALERLASDGDGAGSRRDLVAVRREVMRGCQMTDQLRDFCGTRASIPSHPIDLCAFVSEVTRTLDTMVGKSASILYDLACPGPRVVANRLQLYQILLALVANAVEAIGERGGEIRVVAGHVDADRELLAQTLGLHGAEPGSYALLEVSDTGRGMDDVTSARIFDPFFTTKLAGRGLGLAAVFGIAHQLGAGLLVESEPGQGTRMRILLAAYDRSRAPGPLSVRA
jgi:signal transduction histidine kinase